jgi:hypothetical protein
MKFVSMNSFHLKFHRKNFRAFLLQEYDYDDDKFHEAEFSFKC